MKSGGERDGAMSDTSGALPAVAPRPDPGWPIPTATMHDPLALLAQLAATVGAARAPLLARTLADDLDEAAGWVCGAGRDEFRRGCHALVALAGIAGDSPLEQAARQWLDQTDDTGTGVPEPARRAALSDDARALVAALRALPAPPAPEAGS